MSINSEDIKIFKVLYEDENMKIVKIKDEDEFEEVVEEKKIEINSENLINVEGIKLPTYIPFWFTGGGMTGLAYSN